MAIQDVNCYENRGVWTELSCFGAVLGVCDINGKVNGETRCYISSRKLSDEKLLKYSQNERGVESMHWMSDVIYNEDRTLLMEKDASAPLTR